MIVFVVNCGSSSIKYQLFDMRDESVLAKGLLERIGTSSARLRHQANNRSDGGASCDKTVSAANHAEGIRIILEILVDPAVGVLRRIEEIDAVGHRVVHGGEKFNRSCLIDQGVRDVIREHFQLSPLHNPANLMGIEGSLADMPGVPNVAVFDTAFLSTLPPRAHRYAVPAEWYERYRVRKYGFHGTSHRYVTYQAAELLGKSAADIHLITVHLGNGCSMTAVAGGKAVDHSMGMTPLEGLVMGTRCGDIDPAVIFYMQKMGFTTDQTDEVLNKKSGLLGVSELSNDMRDLLAASDKGNDKASLAVEMFVYRVVKYIGAYYVALPRLDAVVLTGGIGENSLPIRRMILGHLTRLGAIADEARNTAAVGGKAGAITADGSSLPVWVVPTNEELMIARDTAAIVAGRIR